ncbi:hypothetical protein T492DRAFT_1093698 [Pavlovales sp. CCMP2436]|nr:hypothetical protein T492DRAFT_1093698 [Pavlovales sp. CCMP2436]
MISNRGADISLFPKIGIGGRDCMDGGCGPERWGLGWRLAATCASREGCACASTCPSWVCAPASHKVGVSEGQDAGGRLARSGAEGETAGIVGLQVGGVRQLRLLLAPRGAVIEVRGVDGAGLSWVEGRAAPPANSLGLSHDGPPQKAQQ